MSIDRVPPSVELISRISSSVVLGTVRGVGDAQWNTPEGAVPAGREGISSFNVIRLIRVMVDDEMAEGGRDDAELTAWVRGGAIGCHVFMFEEHPLEISDGQRYAFFLDDRLPTERGYAGVERVLQMWPVDDEGRIVTPVDGTITAEELRAKVAARHTGIEG